MINLLPPATKEQVKYARRNVTMIQNVIVVMFISFAMLAILVFGAAQLEGRKNDLKKDIADDEAAALALESYHKEAQDLQAQISLLSNLLGREVKFSDLIVEIGRLMPTGGVLTGLSLTEDKTAPLTLTALTTSEETAAILRKNLAESELFDKSDITTINTNTDDVYKIQVNIDVTFNQNTEGLEQLNVKLEDEPSDTGGSE